MSTEETVTTWGWIEPAHEMTKTRQVCGRCAGRTGRVRGGGVRGGGACTRIPCPLPPPTWLGSAAPAYYTPRAPPTQSLGSQGAQAKAPGVASGGLSVPKAQKVGRAWRQPAGTARAAAAAVSAQGWKWYGRRRPPG